MINKKALDVVINGKPAERIYLCEKDFSLFLCYYFTEYLVYPFAPFHYEMFGDLKDLTERKIRELAWVMFRESAKTSFAKIYLIWLIIYKKKKYLNVDSFDKANAESILFDVVTSLQTNQKILADFGELYNRKRDPDEATIKRISNFITNNGVRVEAHSTQESVRGRLFGEQRPDFVLLDDFETSKTKDSLAYTQQVIKHIDEFKAGLGPEAIVIYLGNYITELGSIQSLIDRAKTDTGLRIRMVGVEDGGNAWPGKYGLTDAEVVGTNKVSLEDKKKQLGSSVYSAEMLNQPIDEETQEFRKELFLKIDQDTVDNKDTRRFVTIDTAISEKAEADFTGVAVNYVDNENKWHLIAKRYKFSPKDLIELLFSLYREYSPEKIGIEKTIYLQVFKPFLDDECRKRNVFLPIVELEHAQVNKHTRIRALLPRYESKSIFHITGQCNDLEEEALRFPRGVHDDVIDAVAYQIQIAEAPIGENEDLMRIYANRQERATSELV
ncbi:MAG: hypothetical protein WCV88_06145 [Patescibacteria group bacterium]